MDNGNFFFIWAIITSVSILGTIFGLRYLRNREDMSLIERGINPRAEEGVKKARPKPFGSLRIGLPLVGAGLGLLIASIVDYNAGAGHDEIAGIYFGLIIALGGLGFYQSYRIEMRWWKEDESTRQR